MTPMRRLYGALLRALPADLRQRDGDEILSMIREQARAARVRGVWASVAFWLGVSWDLCRRAPYEHWRRRHRRRPNDEAIVSSFFADLRFAARSSARQRGATALVLLTLTLAVAANTAVFAILDGVFLRPFPFRESDRLVYLNERAPQWNLEFTGIDYTDFVAWRERATAFESMALFGSTEVNLADDAGAERVNGLVVTHDFPAVLDIRPTLGRSFTREEDRPGQPSVVVIGHALWQTRFGGASDVVGKSLRINSRPATIIGVLPREAEFPGGVKFWLPLRGDPNQQGRSYAFDGIGRLERGVTVEAARNDLLRAHQPIWAERDKDRLVSPRLDPLRQQFAAKFRVMGKALAVGATLVLLIACANVGGATLARSIFRQREIGIRMALGASAQRVGRQLLTESLALAAVAGIAGTVIGRWGVKVLASAAPEQLPGWVTLDGDARLGAFSVGIVILTALLFGLAPALQPRRQDMAATLAAPSTRSSESRRHRRALDALVVAEIALAIVLLAGAGLLVRAYTNLRGVDPGFRADGLVRFQLALPRAKYANGFAQRRFYETLVDRLESLPGVTMAGAITCLPFTCHWGNFYKAEGVAPPSGPGASDPVVLTRIATPGYLETMGITLVRGRFFDQTEGSATSRRSVIVNESFARHMWPGVSDPVGRRITSRGDAANNWITVVGVVKDVKHYGLSEPARPGVYLAMSVIDSTADVSALGIAVRTAGDPAALYAPLRALVRDLDRELPVVGLEPMQSAVERSIAQRRTIAFALAAFAAIALALALGGIYAVLSYVVGRRRHEIGIRMALGAQRGQVVRLVVGQGLMLVLIGLVLGLPAALASSRALEALLVGVGATDPMTYVGVVALLTVTAIASALVPAVRAARVEPKTALSEG